MKLNVCRCPLTSEVLIMTQWYCYSFSVYVDTVKTSMLNISYSLIQI